MKRIFIIIALLLSSLMFCVRKDVLDNIEFKEVVHLKGLRNSNLFLPVGKKIWNKNSLKYVIRFTESCLYSKLPLSPITGLDENSSWNKLIYIGSFNPHTKGANFGWRYYNDRLQISARIYDNDTGDNINHLVLWDKDIDININYILEDRNENGKHYWFFNNEKVAEYDEEVPNTWISQPYFGGGDGLPWQGNVPTQDIKMLIYIY